MILSKAVMSDWDTHLRQGRSGLALNKFGVAKPFTEGKVPVIDITDVHITSLREEWSRLQQGYKLSEQGPGARSVTTHHTDG